MKSVLVSIRPEWVEKIVNGKKTIEVRKSAPKEVPFKVYIYETYDKKKVIGEFICDKVTTYPYERYNDGEHFMPYGDLEKTCLDGWELYDYLRANDGYGWHISDLKIYDKPKELSEFYKFCDKKNCRMCDSEREYDVCAYGRRKPLPRPPQSWCYAEEL